jgi:anaerobic selenocysteine-containing dehydrogenase
MGQVLHGSATTTEAVRRAIQHSQESLRALARRYGVDPKTIAKWKARTPVSDLPTGPKKPRSTVLSVEDEAGTDKVNAIINCHLATGRIGKPGMGPFSVTGQPNAMGGREVGRRGLDLGALTGEALGPFSPDAQTRIRAIAVRPSAPASRSAGTKSSRPRRRVSEPSRLSRRR